MADDVKKRSVTANDSGDVRGASVFHWILGYQPTAGAGDLPPWWTPARDWYLRQTIERESFWAGALSIAVTKMSSLAWELDSDAPRVRNYFQSLLLTADNNQSWVNFLARHLMDFLCTDNGAFVEVVRATSAAGSRILGLVHLDSLRCTRTGDPDYPVIYRDTKGVNHEMQPHQVISFSDMPDPSETYYGVGHCAASRAYRGILKMAAIETYIYEKVSGKRALAVDLVGGISDKQLATAVTSAEEERIGKGYVSYMGAIVVPTLSDVAITHTRINFAELPDGFDREKEFNIGLLQYANAIGLDPQELQPLTGAALGTGTQAEVLSEKGKGKGLAAWRQQWTHAVNQFVLPDAVTFAFDENDLKDTQQKAIISKTRADAMGIYIDKGIVTPSQAAQILADEGEIPDEFVPADQTPGGTLTDSEKPESEADQAAAQAAQPQPADINAAVKEIGAALAEFKEAMDGEQ